MERNVIYEKQRGDFLRALGTAARGPRRAQARAPRTSSPGLPGWVSAAPERASDWLAALVGLMLGSGSLSSFLCSLTRPLLPSPLCLFLPHPSVHTFRAARIPFSSHRQGHTESSKVNDNHFNTPNKTKQKSCVPQN